MTARWYSLPAMTIPSNKHLQHKTPPIDIPLVKSFERHLKAERKDPDTVAHYVGATRQFIHFCKDENLPEILSVSREHVELWMERLHETYRPHTVRNRYIGLRIFFKWLIDDDEIEKSPMERIKPPSLEESPKDIVPVEGVAHVLEFLEKAKRYRDLALVSTLYDTGLRASELADIRTDDTDLDTGIIFLPKTKANRVRSVRLSPRGVRYLDRYLRRPRMDPEYLFGGARGKLTRSGVYQLIRKAFEDAGVKGVIGPHDVRHTSASHVAAAGILSESDAMQLYGWADPDMWRHYTGQARQKAALEAHVKASPLERLPKPKKPDGQRP